MNHYTVSRRALGLPATLVFAGVVLSVVAGLFHAGPPANNHVVAFTEYARSTPWIAVHLGQFAGMLLIVAGLVGLFVVRSTQPGQPAWLGRFGALAAVVSLGLYAVLQAVDGVALKHAVDAWAAAPEGQKAARFASAETMRWLEWAVRSYHSFMFGLSLVLLGWWIGRIGGLPKAIGYVMCLSGLTYLAQGWVLGVEGFSAANELAIVLGIVLTVAWSLWLLVAAWTSRTDKASGQAV